MSRVSILGLILLLAACTRPRDTIHVTYVNARDQQVIEIMEVGIDELPESFEERTAMVLRGARYGVLDADPSRKADFQRAGRLRLMVLPLDSEPEPEVFYTHPTISGDLPGISKEGWQGEAFYVSEDDWRQTELLSVQHLETVQDELKVVDRIYQEGKGKGGFGFTEMHVRSRIPFPLGSSGPSVEELQESFGPVKTYAALVYESQGDRIDGGFAWEVASGITIWGTASADGNVLAVNVSGPLTDTESWAEHLEAALAKHKLVFVDWVWAFSATEGGQPLRDYLKKRFASE